MSARHATLLAALSFVWGGSYLLIKYALDGFSAAMIVSARCLLASLVLYIVLRSMGLVGSAWADVRARPKWTLILGDDRRHRAVPADHLRRARRPERADRGADLARLAVHRAARAVHPAPASRSTAARPWACCSASRASRSWSASSRCTVARRVPRRAGDDRRGVLLRALELRRQGPLRAARRGADLVDLGHRGGRHHAAARPSPPRPATRPTSARPPRSSSSACVGTALAFVIYYELIARHRRRARRARLLPRAGRRAVLRRDLPRRADHGRRGRRPGADPGRRGDRLAAEAGAGPGGHARPWRELPDSVLVSPAWT